MREADSSEKTHNPVVPLMPRVYTWGFWEYQGGPTDPGCGGVSTRKGLLEMPLQLSLEEE